MNKFVAIFALLFAICFAADTTLGKNQYEPEYPRINFEIDFNNGYSARGHIAFQGSFVPANVAEGPYNTAKRGVIDVTDASQAVASAVIQETYLRVYRYGQLQQEGYSIIGGKARETYIDLALTVSTNAPPPPPPQYYDDKKDAQKRYDEPEPSYTVDYTLFHISTLVSRGATGGAQTPRNFIANNLDYQSGSFIGLGPSKNSPIKLFNYRDDNNVDVLATSTAVRFFVENK